MRRFIVTFLLCLSLYGFGHFPLAPYYQAGEIEWCEAC